MTASEPRCTSEFVEEGVGYHRCRYKQGHRGLHECSVDHGSCSQAWTDAASKSPPPPSGTIKATAVPGPLPDTAPFVWDDEPQAELKEALDRYRDALALPKESDSDSEFAVQVIAAARAALVALFARQREAGFQEGAANYYAMFQPKLASLESQLERLKAEQISQEEARALLTDGTHDEDYDGPAYSRAFAKLRRLSLSDQPQ